ncbi:MAG: histidine kinase dimerization/phosphoacceptor domain -containing protein [Bacteroidia bacterium]
MEDQLNDIYLEICRLTGSSPSASVDKKTAVLKGLKKLESRIKRHNRQEKKNVLRIHEILHVVMDLANLKYEKKARITNERNDLDALAVGINMLGEELQASTVSLHEKETLLKEIHHRVKNNLQVISSLLSLQSEKITHPGLLKIFMESQNRIRAMALVHEKLYESSDLSRIDFTKYMHSFLVHMNNSYNLKPKHVQLHMDFKEKPHYFKIDTAIACGLILNELISNSCKYAFPEDRKGNIYLDFKLERQNASGTNYLLQVADDGIGIPETIDIENTDSLGLQLITMLTRQIQGSLDLDRSAGTKFTIRFSAGIK